MQSIKTESKSAHKYTVLFISILEKYKKENDKFQQGSIKFWDQKDLGRKTGS